MKHQLSSKHQLFKGFMNTFQVSGKDVEVQWNNYHDWHISVMEFVMWWGKNMHASKPTNNAE
jgi:hypothetical protein